MDAGVRNNVLPQVVRAHVHQFHGIQSTAPQMRSRRRMGSLAFKGVQHLVVGQEFDVEDGVDLHWVPGKGGVKALKHSFPGHKGFSGAAFLAGAAE